MVANFLSVFIVSGLKSNCLPYCLSKTLKERFQPDFNLLLCVSEDASFKRVVTG